MPHGFIDDPVFMEVVDRDLSSGRHVNPTKDHDYFTAANFHLPDELAGELAGAGFSAVEVLAVEGIGWIARDFPDRLDNPSLRAALLETIRALETEPSLLGTSPHLLAFGTAP